MTSLELAILRYCESNKDYLSWYVFKDFTLSPKDMAARVLNKHPTEDTLAACNYSVPIMVHMLILTNDEV